MNYMNEVVLQGIIVSKRIDPQSVTLTIFTGNATKVANFPKVVFYGKLRNKAIKGYKKGDHVKVSGYIRTHRKTDDNQYKGLEQIVGNDIESTKTIIESNFDIADNDAYKPFTNVIKIAGEITSIKKYAHNLFNVVIHTYINERHNFVPISYYTNDPQGFIETFAVGDEVVAIGDVQTAKKQIKNETRLFQNYVAVAFAKQK